MAGGGDDLQSPKKRKREAAGKPKPLGKGVDDSKKRKRPSDARGAHGGVGGVEAKAKKQPVTAKEKRLAAKEMAESRKKKRNYSLEKELTVLWEKMRCHNVTKEERSKIVSEAVRKMNGKYLEIAGPPVTARVLQTCVKWCSQPERDAIFDTLQPHLLTLSGQRYSVFLVKKLIKFGKYLFNFI